MFKASGLAMLLAAALSLLAVSCAGPVFFKPPVASVATTASSAPGQAAASTGSAAAVAIPGATNVVATNAGPVSTQPSAQPPTLAFLAKPEWNGAEVCGGFALAFLVTIAISTFMIGGSSKKTH